MDLQAESRSRGSHRRGSTLILAAIVAALAMAFASAAQAHAPNTAKAWGSNHFGQLGDGSFTGPEECQSEPCSTTPVAVKGLSGVTAMAGEGRNGTGDSLALLEDGSVMAWGSNSSGELGDGTTGAASDVPVSVTGLTTATAVAAGGETGLALLKDGTVLAWGNNEGGQLGDGTTTKSEVPVAVCAPAPEPCPGSHLSEVTAIAAGIKHSLALLKSGKVVAWGGNGQGQLGDGTTTQRNVPVEVSGGLSGVSAISAGGNASFALLETGAVMAWGENERGDLGDGTTTPRTKPVAVCAVGSTLAQCQAGAHLSGVLAISAGGDGGLALLGGHTVVAWGQNNNGQLGDATSTGPEMCETVIPCSMFPVAVSGLTAVAAIAGGGEHSLALLSNGLVKAWGRNNNGQLGDGLSTGPEPCGPSACSTTPVSVCAEGAEKVTCSHLGPDLIGATGIAGGSEHSLAFGSPPAVTKLIPKKGPASGGTTVIITGTDFTGVTAVKFGSTSATSFAPPFSATEMTAVSPAEPVGTVDLTVTNSWGTSAISSADHFTFTPTVTNVSPNAGSTVGGTSVTITGSGFVLGKTATKFKFDSKAGKSVNCTSTTTCTAVSPAHEAGTVDVRATVKKISSPKNPPADQFTYN